MIFYIFNWQEGFDFHDFDLWEDKLYAMTRKPYLDESTEALNVGTDMEPEEVELRLRELFDHVGVGNLSLIPTLNGGRIEVDIQDDQDSLLQSLIARARW